MNYEAPTRTNTPHGQVIRFAPVSLESRSVPPAFAAHHPGVEWMRYVSKLLWTDPLTNADAVPAECWQGRRDAQTASFTGRTFVSCGRKLLSRADVELLAVQQEMEEVSDE